MASEPSPVPIILDERLVAVFGAPTDPITEVERRSQRLFPGRSPIVWEGDPATFQFSYVSPFAAVLLGHAVERWTREPTFWADLVVHQDDRADAIAYCALATGKGRDHVFEYRALTSDGRIVWLRDIVNVIVGPKGVPALLRGIMFDVSDEKRDAGQCAREPNPTKADLMSASG